MFSRGGFDATKLKASLRLCNSRFDVAKNKKSALMKQNMREVATLLAEDPPKEEKARIRTERLIKDDYMIEAYEILQLECQLLIERVQLLKHSKSGCPPDLVGCVSDLIYAAPRVEIVELQEIKKQLVAKFGKQFAMDADNNTNGVVSQRIVEKLSLAPPTAYLVQTYMSKIAKLYEVDYDPTIQLTLEEAFEPVAAPVGFSVPVAQGTGLGSDVYQEPPSNPDYGKSPTVVKALAYDPKYDTESLVTTGVTSNTSSEAKPAATQPTAPPALDEEANANREHFSVMTGVAPTTPSKEVEAHEDTQTSESDDEDENIVEELRSEPRNPAFNPAAEADDVVEAPRDEPSNPAFNPVQDNKILSFSVTSEAVEVQAFPADVDPRDKLTPSEGMITVHATEDMPLKRELYTVETGFGVPVCKEEEPESKDTDNVADREERYETPCSSPSQLELLRRRFELLGATPSAEEKATDTVVTVDRNLEQVDSPEAEAEIPQNALHEETKNLPAVAVESERSFNTFFLNEYDESVHEENDELATMDHKTVDQDLALADDDHEACVLKEDPEEVAAVDRAIIVTPENDIMEEAIEDKDIPTTVDCNDKQVSSLSLEEPEQQYHCKVKKDPLVVEGEDDDKKKKDNADMAEHITGAALAGGAVGFAVAGSLGGLLGAAGVAHLAANKKGKAGDLARKCGKKVTKMTNKLVDKMERS